MADRQFKPAADGMEFGEAAWKMASTSERDQWMKQFPWPIPPTHQVVYVWDDLVLRIRVVPRPEGAKKETVPDGTAARRAALMAMSIEDLQTLAPQVGVDVKGARNKQQLVTLIQAAEARVAAAG